MKRTLKNMFSYVAMFAMLFALSTEVMAAKKSKTLKTLRKKVL